MTLRTIGILLAVAGALAPASAQDAQKAPPAPKPPRQPLDIARQLAARYPESPIMSYIPGLAWSASLRLAQLTGEEKWKEKPRREMTAFISGTKPAIAEPYQLTSLAGHLAFSDLGQIDGNKEATALAQKAADLILPDTPDGNVKYARNWTDDMFMASSVLARVGAKSTDEKYARAVGKLLIGYSEKLQRPDGLFIHATEGPYPWGRGNGFALLGLTEALTHLPTTWTDRPRVLEIYRRHVAALIKHQSEEGSWRQVVDEPSSLQELTVTAMTVAALARGLRLGWLDKDVRPIIDRGWQAVLTRVDVDATFKDVCASTGAGPTMVYYLSRPMVNGADDRAGAMVMLAAIEMEELTGKGGAKAPAPPIKKGGAEAPPLLVK